MDIVRISTAGSVDDGKSTLIGRLLFETHSITTDRLEAIELASKRKGLDFTDLSLLTDGLVAEREQGITIDVAHIYFQTVRKKFIIADSPGHVEYTRNMVTGASKADVFVILIDARKGILEQTHRHYFIANLLRLRQVVVCVNKMDLVNYSQQVFLSIKSEFEKFAAGIKVAEQQITFIPVSSLFGENITAPATAMPWYQGAPLLTVLESTEVHNDTETRPARFPVQWVVRPRTESHHDYRGYAGQLTTGVLYPGDEVLVLPSQQKTHIASIEKFGASLQQARAGDSVVLTLTSQVDVSRGDVLVRASEAPELKKEWHSTVCWMDATPMVPGKNYLLLHGTAQIRARVETLFHEIHPSLQEKRQTTQLRLNQIGYIKLRSARPLPIESYSKNAATGSFALLDEFTHNTVAVGFAE